MVKKQIAAKQTEYDNLVKNLSAATFAPEIIQDLNNRMKALKAEIETLETADPPEEYSTSTILEWPKAISAAPDRRAVHLLVDRIVVSSDKEKTDVNVISTLTSVGELAAATIFLNSQKPISRSCWERRSRSSDRRCRVRSVGFIEGNLKTTVTYATIEHIRILNPVLDSASDVHVGKNG